MLLGNIGAAMSTALYSDTVVYGEWKTGENSRAFTMSLIAFSAKIGVLLRSAAIALGLGAIHFVANAVPTPAVVRGILGLMTFVPAAMGAIAVVIFYLGYKIEDAEVPRMRDEIAARRVRESAGVARGIFGAKSKE